MKFLVTGGAGFIGSNLVEELLKRNFIVRIIDNFSTGKKDNIKDFLNDIELIEGDIRQYSVVQKAVKGIDVILHQAALPSVPRSIKDPITTNEVNVNGTLNILQAAKEERVEKIIFASSSSVYGDSKELPKRENMPTNPLSPYAVSKLTGEKYCKVFAELFNLKVVVLRYFNVFGPKQDPFSEYSAVIPKFINMIINEKRPTIYGDGTQSRDFTFVYNVVEANILASLMEIEKNFIILNCAGGESISLSTLVQEINNYLHKNLEPIYSEPRSGDIKNSHADISLAQKEIGYIPKISFRDGLVITINYFKDLKSTGLK